ncbi:hypothetical protein MHW47_34730 [Streptomyces sp. OfavH-34-F]|uniref:hypothetical protein n=1 Tax=Streptomyces sp. OfavH-34-F TaxID=2917760 RepID=UPI001EF2D7E1|nr:hypothetical protein [Streptomyces sp. OfavH-34-F]MCG7529575.1 hypothetical protein [Streptomyces sp. OfavH-34-F]
MTVTRDMIGRMVTHHSTEGTWTGVLRDIDPTWMDPASMPGERRHYDMSWVYDRKSGREIMVFTNDLEPV